MKKKPPQPLCREIWVVVHESEGLITEAFTKHRSALALARELANSCPSARTELAKYLIALNSQRDFTKHGDDEEEI